MLVGGGYVASLRSEGYSGLVFSPKRKIREFAFLSALAVLVAWQPATALSGGECLVVCEAGDESELQSMLGQHTVVELFRVRDSSGMGLLHYSLRRSEIFWRTLLDAGWPASQEKGWTPQHEAALLGNLAALRALKAAQADLSAKEPTHGGTPLHVAAFNGHMECVKFLVANGAAVNSRDDEGWTPLSQARDQGYPDIVDWLKKNGATR